MNDQLKTPNPEVDDFFLEHLNKIYCAKTHLAERLPELADQAVFTDLKYAILETCEDVSKQIVRMEEIYVLLEAQPSLEKCEDLVNFIESGFDAVFQQSGHNLQRDLSILFYMSLIESVETASFTILQMAAVGFSDKQITQLLKENMDESKGDSALFLSITSKYINQTSYVRG